MPGNDVEVLVIGAGPTGIGAATRLQSHGRTSWLMVDATKQAGGNSRTDTTPEGFFFDQGGHVVFSHSKYFDELIDRAFGEEAFNVIQRSTYVYMKDRLVPYPFQNNINVLDIDDQLLCLNGLIDTTTQAVTSRDLPVTLDEYSSCDGSRNC